MDKDEFIKKYLSDLVLDAFNSLSSRLDELEKKAERKKRFTPPSIEEVRDYCFERGNSVDPESFHNFYACKNWMVGKAKMASWQAAVRTWEINNEKHSGTNKQSLASRATAARKDWERRNPERQEAD